MSEFGVIDLTTDSPLEEARVEVTRGGAVNLQGLRDQLEEICSAFRGITEARAAGDFGLQTLEVDLTVGGEGRVWFVAKGSLEASVKLTFARATA